MAPRSFSHHEASFGLPQKPGSKHGETDCACEVRLEADGATNKLFLPTGKQPNFWQKSSRKYYLKHRSEILNRKKGYYRRNKTRISKQRKQSLDLKKESAQHIARYHLKLGKFCERCGSANSLERHHPDYSEPLEVMTLCRSCHSKLHRESKKQ
jgi:hypothetical protein